MFLNRRKIFCIGFNKTGTSSLHAFFKACHLESAHNDLWPRYSHIETGKSYFKKQCFSDGEQSDFAMLDQWFPRSLFILNDRNEQAWLHSRIKHVLRFNEANIDLRTVLRSDRYGGMAKDFLADEESAVRKVDHRTPHLRETGAAVLRREARFPRTRCHLGHALEPHAPRLLRAERLRGSSTRRHRGDPSEQTQHRRPRQSGTAT